VPGNNPSNPNTPRACPFCLNSNPSGGGSAAARQAPLHRFEEVCKLPIDIGLFFFACANAGVTLRPPGPMSVAVLLALVVGKSAGITGMALLATKARHRPRPSLDCLASRREFASSSSYVVRRTSSSSSLEPASARHRVALPAMIETPHPTPLRASRARRRRRPKKTHVVAAVASREGSCVSHHILRRAPHETRPARSPATIARHHS
jgi:hypothetical protein